MTKKILILIHKKTERNGRFVRGIRSYLPKGTKITLGFWKDLSFFIEGKNIRITLGQPKIDIKEFDLVYFRYVGDKLQYLAATLAVYLDHVGKPYFDTTFEGNGGNKLTSLVRLTLAGLPTIPTFFSSAREEVPSAIAHFGWPLVVKRLVIQRGKGVSLVKNLAEIKRIQNKFPEEEFLFQKYLPTNEEYRLLVLGNKIGAFERKRRTDPNEFRQNVALGASEEFLDLKKIPPAMKQIALKAAATLKLQIAGVDILVDERGKYWLLEVNRSPGLTYDDKNSSEIKNIASFFVKEIGKSGE